MTFQEINCWFSFWGQLLLYLIHIIIPYLYYCSSFALIHCQSIDVNKILCFQPTAMLCCFITDINAKLYIFNVYSCIFKEFVFHIIMCASKVKEILDSRKFSFLVAQTVLRLMHSLNFFFETCLSSSIV